MYQVFLRSLQCLEPATSFGDDIEIFVDGISVGGQFPIDQGQAVDLQSLYKGGFDFFDQAIVSFKEDTDPAGEMTIPGTLAGQGVQRADTKIKEDGRYYLFFGVIDPQLAPKYKIYLRSIVCNEPATSFGDDIEIFVNGKSVLGQFPIDQGQSRDLRRYTYDFDGQLNLTFTEDTDPAGELIISSNLAGKGVQKVPVKIKQDGRYDLYFAVKQNH